MAHAFAEIAFTPTVRAQQERHGSRRSYARFDATGEVWNAELGPDEAAFIAARDSVYLATVGETGWPYIQHRGGRPGFLKTLDPHTLGFADYRGNRQYISVGNLATDDRVSLFLMDYAHQRRLKLLGRARLLEAGTPEGDAAIARVAVPDYPSAQAPARIERAVLIDVAGFDWNCPQHIAPRFTLAEIEAGVEPLRARIRELEAALAEARPTGPGA